MKTTMTISAKYFSVPNAAFLLFMVAFMSFARESFAKDAPAGAPYSPRGAIELEELVEPIALYPDTLLQPMLPAATFPDQIVDAALLIKSKQDASLIQIQDWDSSVKLIATYPGVLKSMSEKLPWTTELGIVFLNQREDLFATIQSLRQKAQGLGNLKSNQHQTVTNEQAPNGQTVIVVQPADPEVVYIPESTTTVYTESVTSPWVPLASFGAGLALGAALDDDDDHYYYGGGYWGGGPSYWYDDDRFDQWADNRREMWEDHNDRAWDRQENRQDMAGNRQEFRQDMRESGQWPSERISGNTESRQQRADSLRAQHPEAAGRVDARRQNTGSQEAGRAASTRDISASQRSELQQRSSQARLNNQTRSGSTSRSTSGYSGSLMQGYGSRSNTMAASSRGSMSRSTMGSSMGRSSSSRMSGGGARMGGGAARSGGGRRR